MSAILLDGKAVAAKVRAEVAQRAAEFASRHGHRPGLAVVQVGEDPASSVYVRNKRRSSLEAGIESFAHDLPASASEAMRKVAWVMGMYLRNPPMSFFMSKL